jgi:hypothetical protein
MAILAAFVFALIAEPAFAQTPDPAPAYTVNGWPAGLANVPCDAFKKKPDGSWAQTGTIIVQPGNTRMNGNTFAAGRESRMLDQRCGGQK